MNQDKQPEAPQLIGETEGMWMTVVYRNIHAGDESKKIGEHPKVSALSWSHALDTRDALHARIAELEAELAAVKVAPAAQEAAPSQTTSEDSIKEVLGLINNLEEITLDYCLCSPYYSEFTHLHQKSVVLKNTLESKLRELLQ